jgi:hypothetical protein
MQDTGYIGFYPGSRIPHPESIGAEMAQTMIKATPSMQCRTNSSSVSSDMRPLPDLSGSMTLLRLPQD